MSLELMGATMWASLWAAGQMTDQEEMLVFAAMPYGKKNPQKTVATTVIKQGHDDRRRRVED